MANTATLIRQVARRNFRPGSVANVNMSHYSGLTVEKLKTELRCRGATTCGKKIDLIERFSTAEDTISSDVAITDDQAADLESKTRKQAKCSLWHEERRWRLTASQFGTTCKCTTRRNKTKLCEQIVSGRKLVCNSVRHGLQQEPKAIAKLEIACNVQVHSCGMFVDSELPFLAATPDGVIDSNTIVEVKCPYSARTEVIAPGKLFPYLCKRNGLMQLKENSNYYFQVQGQMYLSKRKYCLFAVCTFKDFFVQKISLDEEYCTGSLIPRLSLFFESFLKPYIATHCIC
ncbi:uncharacterized protein [Haliotis cracherodii]|uniref:uncharacterized protein n=1 Tax=Haliotis cracherodii TaxID=6455 RepID=UPI0039EA611E